MLWLVAAVATMPIILGPPMPGDLGMVAPLMSETHTSATRVEVTVDAAGVPVHCAVTRSQGMPLLDRTACAEMLRHAHFTAARDAAGNPVAAVVRQDFTVNGVAALRRANGPAADARQVDYAVQVKRLPLPGTLLVTDLIVMTDATGHATRCDVSASSGSAALDVVACREIQSIAFAPGRDRSDAPIAALRAVSFGFSAEPVIQ